MLYDPVTLKAFWNQAERPIPLVIVGGGRWGRTWASVVSQARGSADGIVMVTRNDPADLSKWLSSQGILGSVPVAPSVSEGVALVHAELAVVASRPRDHLADGLAALSGGAHVLVEKPLCSEAASAHRLLTEATRQNRKVAIGTEFSFLPVFHQCAAMLSIGCDDPLDVTLRWDDPPGEVRYGATKARHAEVSLLSDLLPHAVSVFAILCGGSMRLIEAEEDRVAASGRLLLASGDKRSFQFVCNARATRRTRFLEIVTDRHVARIDFASSAAKVFVDGQELPQQDDLIGLTSSLRLELGAFIGEVTGCCSASAITSNLPTQVRLAEELECIQS